MRYLLIGDVAGRPLADYWVTIPVILGGSGLCLLSARQLDVLHLGEDAARSAGMDAGRVRLVCSVTAVLVTGACVAAVGPIGFVGLALPHMVRGVTGSNHGWLLVYSAIFGAILLLVADVIGRLVLQPAELQAAIVMAAIGAHSS